MEETVKTTSDVMQFNESDFLDLNSVLIKFRKEHGMKDAKELIPYLKRLLHWYENMGHIVLDDSIEKPSTSNDSLKKSPEGKLITCGVIIKDANDKILACVPTGSSYYFDIPKGCANKDEDDLDAAIRECREETGLRLDSFRNEIEDLGVHKYLKHKDIHLFRLKFPFVALDNFVHTLKCTSYFMDKDGIEKPEVSDYRVVDPKTCENFNTSMTELIRKFAI